MSEPVDYVEYTMARVRELGKTFVHSVKGAMISGHKVRVILDRNDLAGVLGYAEYADEIVIKMQVPFPDALVYHKVDAYIFLLHDPKRSGPLWDGKPESP